MMMTTTIQVKTRARSDAIDITSMVRDAVKSSGLKDGICVVYVPHTTAGITINEGADPAVMQDILETLDRMVPWHGSYKHMEGNSPAHIKSTLVGASVTIIVQDERLMLGTWQKIFFCEFDGPRTRRAVISCTSTA